jgi:hypothetical protein
MKKRNRIVPKTKEEAISEAKRFLKNAKEILSKTEFIKTQRLPVKLLESPTWQHYSQ